MSYLTGTRVRVSVLFKDATGDGTPYDPAGVRLSVRRPNGRSSTTIAYVYGVGGVVQRSGTGAYFADILLDVPSDWVYRWESTESGKEAAQERVVSVTAGRFG